MYASFADVVKEYLTPAPARAGLASEEIVRRALALHDPPRLPYSSSGPLGGDFCEYRVIEIQSSRFQPKKRVRLSTYHDEWSVGQQVTGREWDQPFDHPLSDLNKLDTYRFPPVAADRRFGWALAYLKQAAEEGKYVVGRDPILMIARLGDLMGFENMMMAPYTHPQELRVLVERLTRMTVEAIQFWASLGYVHGVMSMQDWGLQTSLQMKPETFREFYKPHYREVVQTCHQHGMHFIWHCCGWIMDIIPDMIELGVDVVQLDQPRLMGHERLAGSFGGKITFFNCVDIQFLANPSAPVTDAQIDEEVADMVRPFRGLHGGLMLRQYIAPHTLGITEHQNHVAYRAFLRHGQPR